jgi:hypothetical protein
MPTWYQKARFTPTGEAPKESQTLRFQFTTRHLLIATALLASMLGVARWVYVTVYPAWPWVVPRIRDSAIVAVCETDANSMLLEFRMRKPFKLVLNHCLEERSQSPQGPGVHILNVKTNRSERVTIIPSKLELLRGYFARFRVFNGKRLAIEANNETKWIEPWSVIDASKAKWTAPGRGDQIGCGAGQGIIQLAASNGSEEWIYLSVSENK